MTEYTCICVYICVCRKGGHLEHNLDVSSSSRSQRAWAYIYIYMRSVSVLASSEYKESTQNSSEKFLLFLAY